MSKRSRLPICRVICAIRQGDLDQLYAVHDSDGQQLALVADRKLAFVLARQHDLSPVAVH